MRETYQPPTTSPAGPPHDHTPPIIPAKAGILHPAASNSRRDGPLSPSTEIDTIRQSPTNHNENSCARVRQRRSVSFLPTWIGFDVSLGAAVSEVSCQ